MVYLYFILGGICMVYVMTDIHGDFYHFYQMLVLLACLRLEDNKAFYV